MIYNIADVQEVNIGHQHENLARQIQFDVSSMQEEWPNCTFELFFRRPNVRGDFPRNISVEGSLLTWTIDNFDTEFEGPGYAEIRCIADNILAKSKLFKVVVDRALGNGTNPPPVEGDWIDDMRNAIVAADEALVQANEAIAAANDAIANTQVDPTLTLSGKPADAKVTGDELNNRVTQAELTEELARAEYRNLVVYASLTPLGGYSADYNSSEIRNHVNGGGTVELRYDSPELGEQVYAYQKYKDGLAWFRRDVTSSAGISVIDISIDYRGTINVYETPYEPDYKTAFALCYNEAAPQTYEPCRWYVPKTLPRPSNEAGLIIDVLWKNGKINGLDNDAELIYGEPNGADNEVIVAAAYVADELTGPRMIPTEGTVRYQLIYKNDRFQWKCIGGDLIPLQFSTETAAVTQDKIVHGMSVNYLPGMEIYLQMDNGNSADVMRIVPDEGPVLPVYGNGTGTKTGNIGAGVILHLINAETYWQIVNCDAIDPTLTQPGQAADAKAVGDALEGKQDKDGGWELIYNVDSDGSVIVIDQFANGEPLKAEAIRIKVHNINSPTIYPAWRIFSGYSDVIYCGLSVRQNEFATMEGYKKYGFWESTFSAGSSNEAVPGLSKGTPYSRACDSLANATVNKYITKLKTEKIIEPGYNFEIYAVRAKEETL